MKLIRSKRNRKKDLIGTLEIGSSLMVIMFMLVIFVIIQQNGYWEK